MPLVTAASRGTSNSLVLHWAVMLFVASHTARRVATLKSLCACCAIVLALAALCTACAVSAGAPATRLGNLIKRFGGASLQSGLPFGAESLEQAERGLFCRAWIPPTLSVTWILHHRLTSSPLRSTLHLYRSTSDTSGHDICLEAALASKQAQLSQKLDTVLLGIPRFDPAVPATKPLLLSEAEPGARAFLAALLMDAPAWRAHSSWRNSDGGSVYPMLRKTLGVRDAMAFLTPIRSMLACAWPGGTGRVGTMLPAACCLVRACWLRP